MRAGLMILALVHLSVASAISMSAEYPGSPLASKHDIYRAGARVFTVLAEQGDSDAQPEPRANSANDSSESQDVAEWSRKAAGGEYYAQFYLGRMYKNGEGIGQDNARAHFWFSLAAAQGFRLARTQRDILARQMSTDEIAEAERLMREWKLNSDDKLNVGE